MNILVTGSKGQLGQELQRMSESINNNYLFTDLNELDITNYNAIDRYFRENDIQVIVNCAAYTNVDKAEDDIAQANLINNQGVKNLALISKKYDATLIHISTDYVFQGDKNTPYSENHTTNPLGIYGKTKREGEISLIETGSKHMIFRTSWLYSIFGNNFVKTIIKLANERDTLNVVFDQVGSPTHAKDLAKAIYEIIETDKICSEGIFHYSNEGVCSWYDFAKEICEVKNISCSIEPCHSSEFPSRVKRPAYSVLDKTKIKEQFSLKIPHWKDSLKEFVQESSTNN